MKKLELRQLIYEEVRKVINEDDALDTQVRNVYRALVFSSDSNMNAAFKEAFEEYSFKFSKDLVPTFLQAIVNVTKKDPKEVERIFSSADVEAVAKIDEKGLYNNGWFNNGVELLQKGIKRLK